MPHFNEATEASDQNPQKTAHILPEQAGMRLDQVLAQLFPAYSRSKLKQWLQEGRVQVNGATVTQPRHKAVPGSCIALTPTHEDAHHAQAQPLPVDVVYEDAHLLVINKAVGMVVHPGAGNPDGTLVNALLHHCPELSALPRAGIVHRLDKDTSGLLIVAKSLEAYTALVNMMKARTIERHYEAIVQGVLISGGEVDQPIGRHPQARTKMAVHHQGKEARTHYRVVARFAAHTHLALKLDTGRTHQIRVHMHHLRHPIVGDAVYSRKQALEARIGTPLKNALNAFKRQALHAKTLRFMHPITEEALAFEAPLPEDMQALLAALREDHRTPI